MEGLALSGAVVPFFRGAGEWASGAPQVLARAWWVFPLFASLASLISLEGSLVFLCCGRTKRSTIPTVAYLISGPSVAAINLSAFVPQAIPPPSWVGALMLVLLLGSAWAYYLSSGEQEDETRKVSGTEGRTLRGAR